MNKQQYTMRGLMATRYVFTDLESMLEAAHQGVDMIEEHRINIKVPIVVKVDFYVLGQAKRLGLTWSVQSLKKRIRSSKYITCVFR